MHLSDLYLYPIKSTAPLPVRDAVVEPRGLADDRRWMVVNPAGRAVTGRELGRLTLVRARPVPQGLMLEAPGMPALTVATPPAGGESLTARVWDSDVPARAADAEADAWLSDFLMEPLRLVHMDDTTARLIDEPQARADDIVSFADAYPLLLVTQASLDGLNARLPQPVPVLRFRPNLVVSGAPAPHAEDAWRRVRVGEVEFDVVKPCSRCVFTTVDPQRGERDPAGEPLRTLSRYRRTEQGVLFGQNLIPRSTGRVRTGDPVEVLA
jgi:uncharacterized protein YcbX